MLWRGRFQQKIYVMPKFAQITVHHSRLHTMIGRRKTIMHHADEQMLESCSAPGDPAALAAEFAGWDGQLLELVPVKGGRCHQAECRRLRAHLRNACFGQAHARRGGRSTSTRCPPRH
jgi:hypothetical protein